jgi:hypothetical protein
MSAPVTERVRTAVRGRTTTIPTQRAVGNAGSDRGGAATVDAPTRRSAGQKAGEKAYARRDERQRRVSGARAPRVAAPAGRPQFVLLIMALLAVGLVATLWLSTAAAADSYRLQDATAEARVLSEQTERLHREVAVLSSAPELARRAAELGMTQVQDPARLVVAPDGGVEVVGEPRAAVAPPPPAPPAPPAVAGTTPEGTTPEGANPEEGAPATGEPGNEDGNTAGGQDESRDGTAEDGTAEDDATQDDTAQLAAPRLDPSTDSGDPDAGDGTTAESDQRASGRDSGTDAG